MAVGRRAERQSAWRLTGALLAGAALALVPQAARASEVPSLFGGGLPELAGGHASEKVEVPWIDIPNQRPRLRTMARVDLGRLSELRDKVERGVPARLRLDLFAGVSPVVRLHRATRTERGYAMSGRVEGAPDTAVTLVAHGDVFYSTAWMSDGAYEVRTVGAAQVVERLPSSKHVCHTPSADDAGDEFRPGADAVADDDGGEVDVLVFYTDSARRSVGGHRNVLVRIDHHVEWTNAAFELSATRMRIRLVGAQELVGYSEASGSRAELLSLFSRDSRVQALSDALAADIVLLHLGSTAGGLAGSATRAGRRVFSIAQMTPRTFAHELGHNMGLQHDRMNNRRNDPFPYSHGYRVEVPRPGREAIGHCTIMCVTGESGDGDVLPRFSNARQRYKGVLLGVPGDEPSDSKDGPADAARSLDEWMPVVAGIRRRADRCDYRLLPPAGGIPAEGGEFVLRVETSAACGWQAESADGFSVVLSGSEGFGSGAVTYAVPPNEGWEREVALAVAGQMHFVPQPGRRQAKPVCERSAHVRDALAARTGKACADIGMGDLLRVDRLDLDHPSGPVQGDFHGLANLGKLDLSLGLGATLAPGAFEGLENLQEFILRVEDPFVATPGVFEGLANVGVFEWHGTRFYHYEEIPPMPAPPPGVFRGLSGLSILELNENELVRVPSGMLAGVPKLWHRLILSNNRIEALPPGIFDGLGGRPGDSGRRHLFVLALDDNQLQALPPGMFAGKRIDRVSLLDNPGAPFDLVLEPKRTSKAWRRPVAASVFLAQGTPLDLSFELSASGLEWRSRRAALPAGAQWSEPLELRPIGRTPASIGVAGLPALNDAQDCDVAYSQGLCHLGLRFVAGNPLTLNAVPDLKMEAERTPWRIDLADVFLEFDSPPLAYHLASSELSSASATVAGDILTVAAHAAGASTITVTAAMADGRSASRTFTVTVTEDAHRFMRGWRLGLPDLPATEDDPARAQ